MRSLLGNSLIHDYRKLFQHKSYGHRPWLITGPTVPPRKRPEKMPS